MDQQEHFVVIQEVVQDLRAFILLMNRLYFRMRGRLVSNGDRTIRYSLKEKVSKQLEHMHDLVNLNDVTCVENLRMNRNSFGRLCYLLENVGLVPTCNVLIPEQVAMFLSILAHHTKNRIIKTNFKRSEYTISKHFSAVLKALLKLHTMLLVRPQPVEDDSTNDRWKYFKGCLGALDGTYIPVKVLQVDKARYRNRKGHIAVNVLAVCDQNMNYIYVLTGWEGYIYVLTGWEGSAADGRVLRDAIIRPNGLKVPGNYYLCDGGYTNANGFLAPYRGVRYHLQEWNGASGPQNSQEYFNLKHAKARNVIERSFGLLKGRWAILRSNSFYPIKVQNRIILACCLLHNFIRRDMPFDPLEATIPEGWSDDNDGHVGLQNDFIDQVESSEQWSNWRDGLATSMYNDWRG